MRKITAAITAVQGYVPDYILTNKELETMIDTTDEWITSRTGVKERRVLKGEGKGASVMGIEAVKGLCKKRGISPTEIDLLICCTVTADHIFPATANIITDKVGATNAFGFDINAACSGFLFGLVTGSKYIESGTHKKVVVVGVDKMSALVDYEDRTTCIIFGDGGGAVLLEPNLEGFGIQDSILKSDGSGFQYLNQKAGGSAYPPTLETVKNKEHHIHQEGQAVFKFAVVNMADVSAEIMEKNNLTSDDKVMLNIQKYGNTTSGTIPLCLWEWEDQLKKGDNIILSAFGGGFTWGAILIKWAYNSK